MSTPPGVRVAWTASLALMVNFAGCGGDAGLALDAARRITSDRLYAGIERIAHDSTLGRMTPGSGVEGVAAWVADELTRVGVQPLGSATTLLHHYPIRTIRANDALSRIVLSEGGTLNFGMSVSAFEPLWIGAREAEAVLVTGASGITDALSSSRLIDRHVVVLSAPLLEEGAQNRVESLLRGARGSVRKLRSLSIITGVDDEQWRDNVRRRREDLGLWVGVDRGSNVMEVRRESFAPVVRALGYELDALAAEDTVSMHSLGPWRIESDVSVVSDDAAPIVVGVLLGTDSLLASEYVAVTAHMDHLGYDTTGLLTDSIFNGADDNASGTAALLELAGAFASLRPLIRRSILFAVFSGEERGLWGSEYLLANSFVPPERIAATINLDMIARNSPDTVVALGLDYSSIGATLRTVVESHPELGITVLGGPSYDEYFSRSDHYSFAKRGVPSVSFFDGLHADYHQPTDDVTRIDATKAARVARLTLYLALELSRAEHRPTWDPVVRRMIVVPEWR